MRKNKPGVQDKTLTPTQSKNSNLIGINVQTIFVRIVDTTKMFVFVNFKKNMAGEKKKQQRQEWLNDLIDDCLQKANDEIINDNHNISMTMLKAGDKCPNCNTTLEYDTFSRQLTCACDLMKF